MRVRMRMRGGRASKQAVGLMICVMIAVFTLMLFVAGNQSYKSGKETDNLKKTGTRVDAEIATIYDSYTDHGSRCYELYYKYTDASGKQYIGYAGEKYAERETAEAQLGRKVKIIIGKDGKSILANATSGTTSARNMMIAGGVVFGVDLCIIVVLASYMIVKKRRENAGKPRQKPSMLKKMSIIVMAYVVASLVLFFAGIITVNSAVIKAGLIALFGGSFVMAVVMMIILFTAGNKKRKREEIDAHLKQIEAEIKAKKEGTSGSTENDTPDAVAESAEKLLSAVTDSSARPQTVSESEPFGEEYNSGGADAKTQEEEMLERINTTYGYENRLAMAEHEIAHVKNAYKTTDKKGKIFGAVFLIVLLSFFIAAPVCLINGHLVAGFCCMGAFAGIIITSLIVVTVRQKMSMSGKRFAGLEKKQGRVVSCSLSSSSSYSTGRYQKTSRVTSVVYRVVINVDGEEKTAYSKDFYNAGDEVTVKVLERGHIALIVKPDGTTDKAGWQEDETLENPGSDPEGADSESESGKNAEEENEE